MKLMLFLLFFPVLAALLCLRAGATLRAWVVKGSAFLLVAGSVAFAAIHLPGPPSFHLSECLLLDNVFLAGELLLSGYLLWRASRDRKPLVIFLVLLQLGLMLYIDWKGGKIASNGAFAIDQLTVLMVLIIGIIGGLIAIFSLWYMHAYHTDHPDIPDRTGAFFMVVFGFLGAMNGLVFSNNLRWLFFFWEVTTASSFWLIGYSQTAESQQNAYRALKLNLLGGVAFVFAISYLTFELRIKDLDQLLATKQALAIVPAIFLSFAALTKSAQMPFSSWLLGAMVAPTPVSALLHSSTMVKAGVYLLVKLSPLLQNSLAGLSVALIGALTFLITSAIAVSQSNAKRVLAYSTIANLGLIVTCAGVGTYETVWAAILLILFHAVAKGLLFLTVGSIEHQLGSREIEDMHGLVRLAPALAMCMLVGIAGMFLAPFGMLLSKWLTLKALVDVNPVLSIFLAFGSAPTLFFWAKWMGKLIAIPEDASRQQQAVGADGWFAMACLAVMTIGACGLFPLVASGIIEPYTMQIYGHSMTLGQANVVIMSLMLLALLLLPLGFFYIPKNAHYAQPYLGGANLALEDAFQGSAGRWQPLVIRNVYLKAYFKESSLTYLGGCLCAAVIVLMFLSADLWKYLDIF